MKKTLVVVLAVLMLCTCVLFAGCQNPKFNVLKDSIIENGEKSSNYNLYSVTIAGKDDIIRSTELIYHADSNNVQLVKNDYYDGASTMMTILIDSKLSGEYGWHFIYTSDGTTYMLGGTFYAARATATNVKGAFVEDISRRYGDMTSKMASIAFDLAKNLGVEALEHFERYVVYQTDLTLADFGYTH